MNAVVTCDHSSALDDTIRVEPTIALVQPPSHEFDRPVERHVERAIESSLGRRVLDLRVTRIGRHVVVTGRAPSYYVKQLVNAAAGQELARPDDGQLLTLANNIRVRPVR